MEKRQYKRFKTRQIVKVCGKLGVVNDISDSGIQLSTAYSPKNRKLDISLDANGGVINLIGVIQWVKWKKQLLDNLARVFESDSGNGQYSSEREAELLKKIGELTVERDFLSNGLDRFR